METITTAIDGGGVTAFQQWIVRRCWLAKPP